MLRVSVHEAVDHTVVTVSGFADDSILDSLGDQLSDLLGAPVIVLDLGDAVLARPRAVARLVSRLADDAVPGRVRIVCPRLSARRALRLALGAVDAVMVASIADALAVRTVAV